jgi:integrase
MPPLQERSANDRGRPIEQTRETLDIWVNQWLSTHCSTAGVRTRWGYEEILRRYLTPEMRTRRITALSASEVQKWVNELSTRGLSPRTVRSAHGALRACLNKAKRLGKITVNVCQLVDLPRPDHREMMTFTAEQAERFLNGAETAKSPYYPLFVLMLHTGMRPGELAGLKWNDWDGTTLKARAQAGESRSTTRAWPYQDRETKSAAVGESSARGTTSSTSCASSSATAARFCLS